MGSISDVIAFLEKLRDQNLVAQPENDQAIEEQLDAAIDFISNVEEKLQTITTAINAIN